MRNKVVYRNFCIQLFLFIVLLNISLAYKMESGTEVHQHITNESQKVWQLIPNEIKQHIKNPIHTNTNTINPVGADFNSGDDIITGSAEEDILARPLNHFWDSDSPNLGVYNVGLSVSYESSYNRAMKYWTTKVIPLYLKGDLNESYYWLGRVAHLLEDASVPAHMHLDPHPIFDSVENYSGGTFTNWNGQSYQGQQYNYENFPNLSNFNWDEVKPRSPTDNQNLELFKLFWYTSQKTQYFASDNTNGNSIYVNRTIIGDNNKKFPVSLWSTDNFTIINESQNVPANTKGITNASMSHSMRAVAGLYRLFDDAVRIDWPTENHDFRRTGFTLLKGDLTTSSVVKNQINFVLDEPLSTMQVVKPTVADLDGNGLMDSVVLVHQTTFNTYTKMYGMEIQKQDLSKWKQQSKPVTANKWPVVNVSGGAIYFPATLANIDDDSRKEIVTGTRNGTIYAYDIAANGKISEKWRYVLEPRLLPSVGDYLVEFNGGIVVDDFNLDGSNEVAFADEYDRQSTWPAKVYILNGNTGANLSSYNVGAGGAYGSISSANIDDDDEPEIVVPSQFGIKVLKFGGNKNEF